MELGIVAARATNTGGPQLAEHELAMPIDPTFKDEVLGRLAPVGDVTARAMFGGFGLFHEGDMFALIKGPTLYFKADDTTRSTYEAAGGEQYVPLPYFSVPPAVLGDSDRLIDWAGTAVKTGHATATKKKRRPQDRGARRQTDA